MAALLVIAALAAGGIVTTDTGDAVANAHVLVTSIGHPSQLLVTDSNGRFSFDPPDGICTIVVTKSGYLRRDVSGACASDAVAVRLQRAAVIFWRVAIDEVNRSSARGTSKSLARDAATVTLGMNRKQTVTVTRAPR